MRQCFTCPTVSDKHYGFSEVQALMTSTKNELRQSRIELMNAKEEARVAKVEVRQLRAELKDARVVAERQREEIRVRCMARGSLHAAL